jgi:D-alanyl-D-alanine carboxypeptidase (penicillin-binding protein 5/6)
MAYKGSGIGLLRLGMRVPVETMLYGLLLPSGNDAAIALAQHVGGTVSHFVALMNRQARLMHLTCTHYVAPDGYIDRDNHSCAADLAVLARDMLQQPRLAQIIRSRSAVEPFPIKGGKLYLYNNNPLLRDEYPGTIGVKTGYTQLAGHCLVAGAERGGVRLGLVLLNTPSPPGTGPQAETLLDAGFRAYGV